MPIRVLIAKPGLDGHDRGAKVIARGLRDAGMEVIYTGLRQSPDMIAEAALQEDVDIVGVSILSGSHMTLVPAIRRALDALDMRGLPLIVGGIVPAADQQTLRNQGCGAVFGPGASLDDIVTVIKDLVAEAPSCS
ncbi:MAG: cobalamin B12-binding domain-containing protein [Chloroflexi bacterium]|nr:cobalamin B12-binding domain-containing protein [Chloroflexota bacterium]